MIKSNKTRLNSLYWEIKTLFYYILFSFIMCFLTSYKNSIALLYLFVSSYENEKDFASFFLQKNDTIALEYCNSGFAFLWGLPKEVVKMVTNNSQKVKSFWSYERPKEITTSMQYPDLSFLNDKDLLTLLDTLNCCGSTSIKFIFTDVEEAFSSTISICFIFSFIFCFLYIVYVAFAFFVPSLYSYETNKWFRRIFSFIFFWFVFIIYLQKAIIPKLAHFLLKFQIQSVGFNVEAETKIYSYCVWASTIFLIANLIFFLVFFVIFAIINRNIQIGFFILHRKWCAVFLLLLSSLIAPPDFFAQLLLVSSFFLFFELLIYFFFIYKNLKRVCAESFYER